MMAKLYSYVGDNNLNASDLFRTDRTLVSADRAFLTNRQDKHLQRNISDVFTFVVDADGSLWIADRQSEHVACARGEDVLSAGEMTFEALSDSVKVVAVTNQSTGYCPEPESWPAVAAALDKAHIAHPNGFTQAFTFRLKTVDRPTTLKTKTSPAAFAVPNWLRNGISEMARDRFIARTKQQRRSGGIENDAKIQI